MNRIKIQSLSENTLNKNETQFAQTGSIGRGRSEQSQFIPMHYEKNYAYPLIVWLHGDGDDHRQIQQVMPLISMRNYVAVAPSANTTADPWTQSPLSIDRAEQAVLHSIQTACLSYNIHSERIFLMGLASGGTMAFRIALRNPDLFGGVISIGGKFPVNQNPLAKLQAARDLPVFLAHGRDSNQYPTTELCENLKLLHCAGFSVTLRQYPCGDCMTNRMLRDSDGWIMEQVTGQTTESTQSNPYHFGEEN